MDLRKHLKANGKIQRKKFELLFERFDRTFSDCEVVDLNELFRESGKSDNSSISNKTTPKESPPRASKNKVRSRKPRKLVMATSKKFPKYRTRSASKRIRSTWNKGTATRHVKKSKIAPKPNGHLKANSPRPLVDNNVVDLVESSNKSVYCEPPTLINLDVSNLRGNDDDNTAGDHMNLEIDSKESSRASKNKARSRKPKKLVVTTSKIFSKYGARSASTRICSTWNKGTATRHVKKSKIAPKPNGHLKTNSPRPLVDNNVVDLVESSNRSVFCEPPTLINLDVSNLRGNDDDNTAGGHMNLEIDSKESSRASKNKARSRKPKRLVVTTSKIFSKYGTRSASKRIRSTWSKGTATRHVRKSKIAPKPNGHLVDNNAVDLVESSNKSVYCEPPTLINLGVSNLRGPDDDNTTGDHMNLEIDSIKSDFCNTPSVIETSDLVISGLCTPPTIVKENLDRNFIQNKKTQSNIWHEHFSTYFAPDNRAERKKHRKISNALIRWHKHFAHMFPM